MSKPLNSPGRRALKAFNSSAGTLAEEWLPDRVTWYIDGKAVRTGFVRLLLGSVIQAEELVK